MKQWPIDSLTERILNITGDDLIEIDRKYKKSITTRLCTRMMVVSNELPRLAASAGAPSAGRRCGETTATKRISAIDA